MNHPHIAFFFRFPAQTSRDFPGPNFRRIEISPLTVWKSFSLQYQPLKFWLKLRTLKLKVRITLHQLHQNMFKNKTPRYIHFRHVGLRQGSWQIFSLGHVDELDGEFSGHLYRHLKQKKYWKYSLITMMLGIICIRMYKFP